MWRVGKSLEAKVWCCGWPADGPVYHSENSALCQLSFHNLVRVTITKNDFLDSGCLKPLLRSRLIGIFWDTPACLIYFKVSNNCTANLINFWKKSNLHALIPSYTFIYFWKKFLPAQLFHFTQLLDSLRQWSSYFSHEITRRLNCIYKGYRQCLFEKANLVFLTFQI